MRHCEGVPNGPCPGKRSGECVSIVHDLELCQECKEVRFPELTDPKQYLNSRRSSNVSCRANNGGATAASAQNAPILVDALLAYVWFSLQGGTAENVRLAALGHFSPDQISHAKNLIWDKCSDHINIIGEKIKRKDSTTRSEKEANIQDIIVALNKLDKADVVPKILIDAADLGMIPRSHPEELNNISLVDRLNRLEQRVHNLQDGLDRTVCENVALKQRLDKLPVRLYADAVTGSPGRVILNGPQAESNLQRPDDNTQLQQQEQQQSDNRVQQSVDAATATFRHKPQRGRAPTRGRGRGRGRGSYIRAVDRDFITPVSGGDETDTTSLDRVSSIHREISRDRSQASDEFRQPGYALRREKRQQRRRQKVITGSGTSGTGTFKGAPEPTRSMFVYRVDPQTNISDLRVHLQDMDIEVREIACVSHPDSIFKSFKLDVPISVVDELLNGDLWPKGIKIRRFFSNRETKQQTEA